MADNRQRPTETRASIEWLEALESDTYKRFSWEYFEKSEGDELKRLFTAGLSLSEAVSYAKGKNWLQGGLFYAPIGRWSKEIVSFDMKGLYTYHSGKNEENLFETRELTKDFVARAAKNA